MIERIDGRSDEETRKIQGKIQDARQGILQYIHLNKIDPTIAFSTIIGLGAYIAVENNFSIADFASITKNAYEETWKAKDAAARR